MNKKKLYIAALSIVLLGSISACSLFGTNKKENIAETKVELGETVKEKNLESNSKQKVEDSSIKEEKLFINDVKENVKILKSGDKYNIEYKGKIYLVDKSIYNDLKNKDNKWLFTHDKKVIKKFADEDITDYKDFGGFYQVELKNGEKVNVYNKPDVDIEPSFTVRNSDGNVSDDKKITGYYKHGDHWHVQLANGTEYITYKDPSKMTTNDTNNHDDHNHSEESQYNRARIDVVKLSDLKNKNIVSAHKHGDHWHVYDKNGKEYLTYDNPSSLVKVGKNYSEVSKVRKSNSSNSTNKNNSNTSDNSNIAKVWKHGDHYHVQLSDGTEYLTYKKPNVSIDKFVNKEEFNKKVTSTVSKDTSNNNKNSSNVANTSNNKKTDTSKFIKVLKLKDLKNKNIVKASVHGDHWHLYDDKGNEYLTYDDPSSLLKDSKNEEYEVSNNLHNKTNNDTHDDHSHDDHSHEGIHVERKIVSVSKHGDHYHVLYSTGEEFITHEVPAGYDGEIKEYESDHSHDSHSHDKDEDHDHNDHSHDKGENHDHTDHSHDKDEDHDHEDTEVDKTENEDENPQIRIIKIYDERQEIEVILEHGGHYHVVLKNGTELLSDYNPLPYLKNKVKVMDYKDYNKGKNPDNKLTVNPKDFISKTDDGNSYVQLHGDHTHDIPKEDLTLDDIEAIEKHLENVLATKKERFENKEFLNGYEVLEYLGFESDFITDLGHANAEKRLPLDETNIENMKKWLSTVTSINLGQRENPLGRDGLKYLTNLERLGIGFTKVTNIERVKEFNNLKSLLMTNSGIKSYDFLKDLPNLEELDISQNDLTDVSFLSEYPNLKVLAIANNKLENIDVLKNLTKLEGLNIDGLGISDISFAKNLSSLRFFSAESNNISDISSLKSKNLERLYLSKNKITSLTAISNLDKLSSIDVNNNEISALENVKNETLETLNIENNKLSSLEGVQNLTNLVRLNADYNDISSLEISEKQNSLENINLANNSLVNLEGLNNFTKLDSLSVKNNKVETLRLKESNNTLTFINIENNLIPENELEILPNHKPKALDAQYLAIEGGLISGNPKKLDNEKTITKVIKHGDHYHIEYSDGTSEVSDSTPAEYKGEVTEHDDHEDHNHEDHNHEDHNHDDHDNDDHNHDDHNHKDHNHEDHNHDDHDNEDHNHDDHSHKVVSVERKIVSVSKHGDHYHVEYSDRTSVVSDSIPAGYNGEVADHDNHEHDGHNHDDHSHEGHKHDEHNHYDHSHEGHKHDGHNHDNHEHDGHNHDEEGINTKD